VVRPPAIVDKDEDDMNRLRPDCAVENG